MIGSFKLRYARLRFRLINLRHRVTNLWLVSQGKAELLAWIVMVTVLALLTILVRTSIEPLLNNEQFLDTLRATALGLGSALLGSTAIVASLALFAMQVNVERLPYGLFRRLSSDSKLLSAFGAAFVASIIISTLPLVTPIKAVQWALFAAVLLTVITLRLFLFAYRRALVLINPVQQLNIVIDDVSSVLERWGNQANWYSRMSTLIQSETETEPNPLIDSSLNPSRAAFMLQNDWGVHFAKRGIDHCIAISGRAAARGDYLVTDAALTALGSINTSYINAKGKTFFSDNGFFETPFATDLVINQSLEQLKRQFRIALERRDEEHINMLLKTYSNLTQLYAQIDYGRPEANSRYASLAISHLTRDVKSIIPQNLPDCMMHGVRILGGCAVAFLNQDKAINIVSIVNDLSPIGAAMAVREDHRPVTITTMEQLAGLTHHMINNGVFDPGYTFEQLCHAVQGISTVSLNLPNPPLSSVHRSLLAPYFSVTTGSALGPNLKQLINIVTDCPETDEKAKKCVANLHEWAKRTQPIAKDIMLIAIEKRSPFVFDIMHWIGDIVEILLAAAEAPVSQEHFGPALEKQAERWLQTLSWIPNDANSLDCAATWSATSVIFEIAGVARKWNSETVYVAAQKTLLRWTLRAARRADAFHEVEEAILAWAALALKSSNDTEEVAFKTQFATALQADQIPEAGLLLGAAQGLKRCINDYDQDMLNTKEWHHIFKTLEPEQRRQLLTDLADMLEDAAAR